MVDETAKAVTTAADRGLASLGWPHHDWMQFPLFCVCDNADGQQPISILTTVSGPNIRSFLKHLIVIVARTSYSVSTERQHETVNLVNLGKVEMLWEKDRFGRFE